MDSPEYDIEITRVLDAPPDRVFQAFTDADQFVNWYGPVGFPVDRATVELDARVGGRQRFVMVSDGSRAARVKRCEGSRCSLLFVDTSRSGRRRWCSMERCGNRAKVAAHRRRRKEAIHR